MMTAFRAAKAIGKLRHLPAIAIARRVGSVIPFRPVDVARLRFLTLDAVPRVPPGMLRGPVGVRRGTPSDLPELNALQRKPEVFRSRFADGDRCIVAVADGRIVGYEWFCDHPVHREPEFDYPIAIPPGAVYAYDAYVAPAYRNTGVWLRFKAFLGQWMAAHGKDRVITFVEDGNLASWRTHIRFGFRPADTVLAFRAFGVTRFRVTQGGMPDSTRRAVAQPAASLLAHRSTPPPVR